MMPTLARAVPWCLCVSAVLVIGAGAGAARAQAAGADFDAIVSGVATRPRADSCRLMQAWVDLHGHDTAAAQGLLWIGRLRLLDGRTDLARQAFERIVREWPNTPWRLRANKELADLDLAVHRYSAAIEAYDELAGQPDAFWANLGRSAASEARDDRMRFMLGIVLALAMLVTGIARVGLAWQAGPGAWRVPREALVALPVVGFMLFAAEQQPAAEAEAAVTVALGGLAVLWTTAVHLRGRALRVGRRVGESMLALVQAAALAYCAIEMSGLWLKFMHTVMMGEVD